MPNTVQMAALRNLKKAYDELIRTGGWKASLHHLKYFNAAERPAMEDIVRKGERGDSNARFESIHMILAAGTAFAVPAIPLAILGCEVQNVTKKAVQANTPPFLNSKMNQGN